MWAGSQAPGAGRQPAGRDTSRAWMPSSSGVTVRPVAGHARRRRRKDAGEVVGASGWRAVSRGSGVCVCVRAHSCGWTSRVAPHCGHAHGGQLCQGLLEHSAVLCLQPG